MLAQASIHRPANAQAATIGPCPNVDAGLRQHER